MSITLVLGGARSGKSRFAEGLSGPGFRSRCYLATAEALDEEMRARIEHHQQRRGKDWTTTEVPLDLVSRLPDVAQNGDFVLVDCLTIWLSNIMAAGRDWRSEVSELCAALPKCRADVALVSNEIGLGLVPETALGRTFRDAQGSLNQQVAATANTVVFVAAGLPLVLKGTMPPIATESR